MRAAALTISLFVAAMLTGPGRAATVEITVDGLELAAGDVRVALCADGLGEGDCRIGESAPATGSSHVFVLDRVRPGTYAVAAFQDLNGNGRLDRTRLGLPLEPYGFSGQVGRRTRPDFRSASIDIQEPGSALRIRLQRALPLR